MQVIAADQPIYALAKQIQWHWPDSYGEDKFVITIFVWRAAHWASCPKVKRKSVPEQWVKSPSWQLQASPEHGHAPYNSMYFLQAYEWGLHWLLCSWKPCTVRCCYNWCPFFHFLCKQQCELWVLAFNSRRDRGSSQIRFQGHCPSSCCWNDSHTPWERQNSIPAIHEGVRKQGCMQILWTNQEEQVKLLSARAYTQLYTTKGTKGELPSVFSAFHLMPLQGVWFAGVLLPWEPAISSCTAWQ